jgi:hypothetical protein
MKKIEDYFELPSKIKEVYGYYRNYDKKGFGVGIVLAVENNRLILEKAFDDVLNIFDDAEDKKDYLDLCMDQVRDGKRQFKNYEDLVFVLLAKVYLLQREGRIKSDNFNGMLAVGF